MIIPPPLSNRASYALNTLRACVAAGVEFVVLLSVPMSRDTVFGRQFAPIDDFVKTYKEFSGWCVLRLPLLLEHHMRHVHSALYNRKISVPCKADAVFTPLAARDLACAYLSLISRPPAHAGKTYTLRSM